MSRSDVLRLVDHPLAGFVIAGILCFYYPLVVKVGSWLLSPLFKRPLAEFRTLTEFRSLGSELSTLSLAVMGKAVIDPKSLLNEKVALLQVGQPWMFYAWLVGIHLIVLFSPAVFVRFALLQRERARGEQEDDWALFIWRWTLVSWVIGFVNLHMALRLALPSSRP